MSERISPRLIGYRVKAAREHKGWSQEHLSTAMGFNDRQTLSDIEQGKRQLRPDELVQLSDILEHDIEYFLDPFAVVGEAQFNWRAAPEIDEASLDAFELKAGRWIGLLRWLKASESQHSPLKHSLRLTAQSSFEDAQARAERLVQTLNLGDIPAERLIERVENDLDIPILFVDTVQTKEGASISGATCHLQDLGIILINRHEPEARRFYDLAHELFHALTWDAMKPEHRESNSMEERSRVKRIEQLANNFAAALLMPVTSLNRLIDQSHANDASHLAEVAAQLHVAPSALAWRLFNLKRITEPTRQALLQERQRLVRSQTPARFSRAFVTRLHQAIDRGQLSARKAARTMDMTLTQLLDLFSEYGLPAPYEL